jgi:hypothetical protein
MHGGKAGRKPTPRRHAKCAVEEQLGFRTFLKTCVN